MFTCQELKTLNGDNKKGPERGLIFRMGCRRRTDFAAVVTDLVADSGVVASVAEDAVAAVVAGLDSAAAQTHAG